MGDGGHLGYWQPYWTDLNIWAVFITLFEHLLGLKHKIYHHNYLSEPSAALLRQKMGFGIARGGHLGKWRPYWNFAWPAFFSWRETPIEYLCQICCLYHNLNNSSDICNYLLHYMGELGRVPTCIVRKIIMIKYWLKLFKDERIYRTRRVTKIL